MTDDKNDKTSTENVQDFLQVFKRGVQFTEELLAENERLRIRLVRLEEENRTLGQKSMASESYGDLLQRMQALEEERSNLLHRFHSVEDESTDFKRRYKEIEEENNRLANLYIASFQLFSTLDLNRVVDITFEIVINLVGSKDFSLNIADEDGRLVPVRAEGRPLAGLPITPVGQGVAGRAAQERTLFVADDDLTETSLTHPKACIPLVVADRLIGMIIIFSFLSQKPCITELDRELFKLLGGHAAMAVYATRLHAEAMNIKHNVESYLRLLNA